MADDGSGSDIAIPSMLISLLDADAMKESLSNNVPVTISMAYSIPATNDTTVHYDLFSTPTDTLSLEFLLNWKPMAMALGEDAFFTPHPYIYDGNRAGCRSEDGENVCYNLCTNNGLYCSIDPDDDLDFGISGADVVAESLNRICIWQDYGEEDGMGAHFWDYIVEFHNRCNSEELFTDPQCAREVHLQACINPTRLWHCIKSSGGLQEGKNELLEESIRLQEESGIVILPTMLVNGAALRGELTVATVFLAICSAYDSAATPSVCTACRNCTGDLLGCVSTGSCTNSNRQTSTRTRSATLATTHINVRDTQLVVTGMPPVNNYALGDGGIEEIFFALSEDYSGVVMCDIDLGKAANEVGTAVADYINNGKTPGSIYWPEQCTDSEKQTFEASLDTFQSCSQWDVRELIETLPSALVGTALKCANLILGGGEGLKDLSPQDLHQCSSSILGDNPLGKAVRSFYLYPDKTCPCLQSLSEEHSIPECTLDVWPIPLAGSWLKTSSCIMSVFACSYFDGFCLAELQVLDKCLPGVDEPLSCGAVQKCNAVGDSFSLSLPPSLLGTPLPDACIRVYGEHKKEELAGTFVTERYDIYRHKCAGNTQVWQPLPKNGSTSQTEEESSRTSLLPGFVTGLVVGLVVAAVLMAILQGVFPRRKAQERERYYNTVELVESSPTLS
jgi:hypothetical protein